MDAHYKFLQDPVSGQPSRHASVYAAVSGIWIFAFAILVGGLALYQSAKDELTRHTNDNLATVAGTKVLQIHAWLDEGRIDMAETIKSPWFMSGLQAWRNDRKNEVDRKHLLAQMNQLAAIGRFREVSLLDPADGSVLLSTGMPRPIARDRLAMLKRGITNGTVLDDFHSARAGEKDEIILGLISPINIGRDTQPTLLMYVTLDYERHLNPILEQWPGVAQSGRTILVAREGRPLVSADGQLNLPTPPDDAETPHPVQVSWSISRLIAANGMEAKAPASGQQDTTLTYNLPVPGTSWMVAAKVDADEVYGNLNLAATIAVALFALGVLLATWAVALRHRRLTAEYRGQVERQLLSKRYEILVKYANDCIIVFAADSRIIDINDRGLAIYGYDREQMLTMTETDLLPDEAPTSEPIRTRTGDDKFLYEALHRRRDGSVFPVEISEVITEIDGAVQTQRIIRDISERKTHEVHIAQLSRLSRTLSAVNHAIAHAADQQSLFDTTCRACVKHGGFKLAWIGLADPTAKLIQVLAAWGDSMDFLNGISINTEPDVPEGLGPSGTAFREQRTCICNDYAGDPLLGPWQEKAAQYGIRSSIALPISRDGVAMGVLSAYSESVDAFDPDAEHLLQHIADGLSFALHHFAQEAAKREAMLALEKREQQLLKAEKLAKLGHWEIDLEHDHIFWSAQMYELFDRNPALGPAEPVELYTNYYTPESAEKLCQGTREAIKTGQRLDLELELNLPGERTAYHLVTIVPNVKEGGRSVALHGTLLDITERKLNEMRLNKLANRLAQSAREYEDLYQNAPCGYYSLDKEGVFQRANDTQLKWLGYSREELIGKKKMSDLLPAGHAAKFKRSYKRLVDTGKMNDLEQQLVCKDDGILPVLISATVIRDETGQFLMSRCTTYNMTERKKAETERDDYARRLSDLSKRLVRMQEEERKRLSASLHDRTSPNLAAIGINLSTMALAFSDEISSELAERLEDIRALLEDTTASIREISTELRPPLLDYAGLCPALESYLYQFSKRTGIAAHLDCSDFNSASPAEIESLLFRITQEALTNCAKHAAATSVEVVLANSDKHITLDITDNGNGFDPERVGAPGQDVGLGVLNMREMTEFAGGRFILNSKPGQGTSISVTI